MTTTIVDGTNGITFPDGYRQNSANIGEGALTQFYHPAAGSAFQDMYRSGWMPGCFNQQWGGAQWGTLPDGTFGSVATGNVQDDNQSPIGAGAANYYRSTGFIVPETATYDVVLVKLFKNGNPTGNVTARIYTNSAGSPSAAIGSAATLACQKLTSKADGEWYQITGLAAALTAGTQYHLALTISTTDATNNVSWKYTAASKYPHGYLNSGTSVPAWTPTTGLALCFLIQNPAANSLIQSGGQFDYKLAFANGSPVNQSRSVAQPLVNFYDGKNCSVLHRGTYAVSTNVWDFSYGLDHDRITLTINGSGYPVLTIYRSDRTVYTVTGTGSVTTGFHDVGIKVRTVGDTSDYATLYVDGVSVGTPLTAQTFSMDTNMKLLGTARLGDGFGLAPTWTQDMQMTSLPSAQGWTWTGTATEANCMSVSGGKLYQNANGYTSTQTGYYAKTVAFVNATGWAVSWKGRVVSNPNTSTDGSVFMRATDASFGVQIVIAEYFLQTFPYGSSTPDFTIQGDFKSQEHVFTLQGKGSDYYLFIDGKLAVDGTGKLTTSSGGTSVIWLGDASSTASANADAIWSYVKYYQGGMLLPTANSGTCSEFTHWSGDKSSLFSPLWNSGTPVSVKQLCGVPRNYVGEGVVQREVRRGVTSSPTTTATSATLVVDMESYVIGQRLSLSTQIGRATQSVAGATVQSVCAIDGVSDETMSGYYQESNGSYQTTIASKAEQVIPLGLHKCEGRWYVSGNTGTSTLTSRNLTVEARS